jgi:hypothetical protein
VIPKLRLRFFSETSDIDFRPPTEPKIRAGLKRVFAPDEARTFFAKIQKVNFIEIATVGMPFKYRTIREEDGLEFFYSKGIGTKGFNNKVPSEYKSDLESLGMESEIRAGDNYPVTVLGDGMTGSVASELKVKGFTNVKSYDLLYTEKALAIFRKTHPEAELKDYQEFGDARKLEEVGSNSQKLVLAKDLLSVLSEKGITETINTVGRILMPGGEGRLSFHTRDCVKNSKYL